LEHLVRVEAQAEVLWPLEPAGATKVIPERHFCDDAGPSPPQRRQRKPHRSTRRNTRCRSPYVLAMSTALESLLDTPFPPGGRDLRCSAPRESCLLHYAMVPHYACDPEFVDTASAATMRHPSRPPVTPLPRYRPRREVASASLVTRRSVASSRPRASRISEPSEVRPGPRRSATSR
jgi:hypothetical protein